MIGVLVQVLSLFSGLMVNFLTPFIFGVESYGLFIKMNILVYVFHRFSDISSESLIALNVEGCLFLQSLVFNVFYFLTFLMAARFFEIGSPLLLAGMLLSSTVLLTLYSQKKIHMVMMFLFSVVFVFLALVGLIFAGLLSLSIEQLMIFSTYPSALAGFLVLTWLSRRELVRFSSYSELWRAILMLPRMVSLTLVFNLLTNFLPYIATKILLPREVGTLRIMLAVVQSVSSIFPLNIKQIFSSMMGSANKQRLYISLMQVSVVYFLLIICGLLISTFLYPPVKGYVLLVPILPVFFWSMLTERYLQSCHLGGRLLVVNLFFAIGIFVAGIFCDSLDALILIYLVSIISYCATLMGVAKIPVPIRYYIFGAACLPLAFLIETSLLLAFVINVIAIIGFLVCGPSFRTDIEMLRREVK